MEICVDDLSRGPQGAGGRDLFRKGRGVVPVHEIRERVERREYEVDADQVARAILRRLGVLEAAPGGSADGRPLPDEA